VYNHVGPDGNVLPSYADAYFTDRYPNDWGRAINFDGPDARPVREFFLANARYWIEEFHFDGLRLDATQSIHDASASHIVAEIVHTARAAAGQRAIVVVAENEPQDAALVRAPAAGGLGVDALWNDDIHHTARVAVTGRREAYYTDYEGRPQELISAVKHGFLFQGQRYSWQRKPRGTPAWDVPAAAFVAYLQNHDQVANSGRGERLHRLTSPGRLRAMTALLLLAPQTPLLFQGQEFCASSPFLYFADQREELARGVRRGRREFLAQFPSLATSDAQRALPAPDDTATFERSKLDLGERERHAEAYALHRDLLQLRRHEPAFARQDRRTLDGAVLADEALVLRFFEPTRAAGDRLLIVNLGRDLALDLAPEPLLAPPAGGTWRTVWSSEDVRYGGTGTPPVTSGEAWRIPGHAALVMAADG
jgi:maltooligosyltrehalose trehalohydrolase